MLPEAKRQDAKGAHCGQVRFRRAGRCSVPAIARGECLTDVVETQTPALDYAGTAVRKVGEWDAKLGCRSRGLAENGEQTEKRWLYL